MIKIFLCLTYSVVITTISAILTGITNGWVITGLVLGIAAALLVLWYLIDTGGQKDESGKEDDKGGDGDCPPEPTITITRDGKVYVYTKEEIAFILKTFTNEKIQAEKRPTGCESWN